ncbi:MAG: glycerol-3-phosphate dehydrogenase/oxidase [Candidatus Nanopelagicales bacterium]
MSSTSNPRGRLDPEHRARSWQRLRDGVDVLVVGGGVTGCGVALDAALRGFSVGLVEQRDFAAGTSSRSSKLVHGGLRYLEQLNVALVREALRERALLLDHLAPHLVRPLPFLYPLAHRIWERPYVGAGLTLYDTLGGLQPSVPRHSHLSRSAALRAFPSLRPETVAGAIRYHDAQVDDARHTLELARTAAAHGAALVSAAKVSEIVREGDQVVGARVSDATTGETHDVPARVVVNATGVWAGVTEQLAGVETPIRMRPSKGVHIVVPGDRIDASLALITKTRTSVLFVLPWGRSWVIGTTDTAWHHGFAHPSATHADLAYLLEQANAVLTSDLDETDVIGLYAGLRPLVDTEGLSESEISREHTVRRPLRGLVTVAGGKYTTYRVMAEDTVDACGEDLFPGRPDLMPPSRSADVPLVGACEPAELLTELAGSPGTENISAEHLDRLAHRYGRLLPELLLHLDDEPDLAQEVPGGAGTLAVEVVHAATHEGALHVEDVLTRRTRLYLEAGDRGLVAARVVAHLMGDALGWDEQRRTEEVSRYQRRVAAELDAQAAPDDAAAAAIRERVSDPRIG